MINSTLPNVVAPAATTPQRTDEAARQQQPVRQDMPGGGKNSPLTGQSNNLQQAGRVNESLTRYLNNLANELQFRVDDATGDSVMTIYNTRTNAVVRQVPSEEVLAMSRYLQEQLNQQAAERSAMDEAQ